MKCPYCDREMLFGALTTNRDRPCFIEEGRRLTFGEAISGVGQLTATKAKGIGTGTPAHYCSACRKMIIETGVCQ